MSVGIAAESDARAAAVTRRRRCGWQVKIGLRGKTEFISYGPEQDDANPLEKIMVGRPARTCALGVSAWRSSR